MNFKMKNSKKTPNLLNSFFLILKDFYNKRPGTFLIVILFLSLSALFESMTIITLFPLFNVIIEPLNTDVNIFTKFIFFILLIVLFSLLKALFLWATLRFIARVRVGIEKELRIDLLNSLSFANWNFFLKQPVGRMTNTFATEANRGAESIMTSVYSLTEMIRVSFYLVISLIVDFKLTLIAIASATTIFFLLKKFIKISEKAGEKYTSSLKFLTKEITDYFQGIKFIKSMNIQSNIIKQQDIIIKHQKKQINVHIDDIKKAILNANYSSVSLKTYIEPLAIIFLAAMVIFFVKILSLPIIEVGVLGIIFIRATNAVGNLPKYFAAIAEQHSALWSVKSLIKESAANKEKYNKKNYFGFNKSINLKNIHQKYDKSLVLKNINLEIRKNKITQIKGISGSGKTTILDLISGLIKPLKGDILLDKTSIKKINLGSWREKIGYVPQELFMFHENIKFNLTFNNEDISENYLSKILQITECRNFINKLPRKLKTTMGERGMRFSAGQRQRLSIARAMVKKPDLLILDEATSSLDPRTEKKIAKILREISNYTTILIVTHTEKLDFISDRIYQINNKSLKRIK